MRCFVTHYAKAPNTKHHFMVELLEVKNKQPKSQDCLCCDPQHVTTYQGRMHRIHFNGIMISLFLVLLLCRH